MPDRNDDRNHGRRGSDDSITGSGAPERKNDQIDLSRPDGEIVDKITIEGDPQKGGPKD